MPADRWRIRQPVDADHPFTGFLLGEAPAPHAIFADNCSSSSDYGGGDLGDGDFGGGDLTKTNRLSTDRLYSVSQPAKNSPP